MSNIETTDDFFKGLPLLKNYRDVTIAAHFRPAPRDWHVVIADVVNSTGAIQSGEYKNVNVLGAMIIVGLLNASGRTEFPFVFGGDGSSCLIPPALLPAARRVLLAASNRARESFHLTLRVGIVPIARVMADGYTVGVAKLAVSEQFAQAVFSGGGLSRAEQLIKRPPAGEAYELPADPNAPDADFSGLECRWNPVRSEKGEIVSLLIQARGANDEERNEVYREVVARIESTFGDAAGYRPASERSLSLTKNPRDLQTELNAKHARRAGWIRWLIRWWMMQQNRLGTLLFGRDLRFHLFGVDWVNYKRIVVQNTDHQKFDDMIRMVISCTAPHRLEFEKYLVEQRDRGRLHFGLHVTDSALLTCLIFDRLNRHFHFVDGSNGGYTLAAKALKEQIYDDQYNTLFMPRRPARPPSPEP